MRVMLLFGWLCFSFSLHLPVAAQTLAPLPHSGVAKGEKQVVRAWLANPTTRYQHFVLGDPFEAASLVVEMRDGKILQYDLPSHLVFEDRHVRLADLNNDGHDELIVVMSSVLQGAALAVFKADETVELLAQTPHIGLPFRWLNPAGIADFDGDGALEIALVQKPHLTKRLEFWRLTGGALNQVGEIDGFSNHRNGSRNQLMSAIFDVNKDGKLDLLLPGPDRLTINAVTLSPTPSIIQKWRLPSPIDADIKLLKHVKSHVLSLRLQNGNTHQIELH